jgi:H+/Cl- antiporter ClcA
MALPLTLGLGTEGLVIITENAQQIGAALLIVLALAKIVALAGALNTGFIGGPIFPLFFVGGAVGSAVSLIFPAIPPALAVGAVMAAVVSAGLPVTFSMSIIVMLIVGLPATEMVPVFLAGLVALVTTHGLGLVKQGPPPQGVTV